VGGKASFLADCLILKMREGNVLRDVSNFTNRHGVKCRRLESSVPLLIPHRGSIYITARRCNVSDRGFEEFKNVRSVQFESLSRQIIDSHCQDVTRIRPFDRVSFQFQVKWFVRLGA
jgi:hypothetical protein